MLTRPDSHTVRDSLQTIGSSLSGGIGRSASDLVEVFSGLAETAPIRRTRMPRPSMLVRALIVGLFTAAVVAIVAGLWKRNERTATQRRQATDGQLDQEALDRADDEGMTAVTDAPAEDDLVGLPIVADGSARDGVTSVA
jgi:hypothetical protein